MIVVQNMRDMYDTRCLIFSDLKPDRIIMLKSGDCDKYSWMYSDAGIRQPIIDFSVSMEDAHCHYVTTTTHAPPEPINDGWGRDPYRKEKQKGLLILEHISNTSPKTLTTVPLDKYFGLQQEKPNKIRNNNSTNSANSKQYLYLKYTSMLSFICIVLLLS